LKGGRAKISMGTAKKPCFRDLRLKMTLDGKTYAHHVKIGFSPTEIRPFTQEPKDFWTFWQQQLEENKKMPMHYTKEFVAELSNERVECYRLKIDIDRQRHSFYAYLLMPKGAKKASCPVVLTPPGAGVKTIKDATARRFYPENGFIRLAIEIHGLNPTMTDQQWSEINAAFNNRDNGYLRQNLENRDQYYMRHVYLGLVRCIDVLTSLPEWDGRNVFVQGGSQGGALALIASALDTRITGCCANHPALSDMAAGSAGLTSGYPHFTKESGAYNEACMKVLPYYDVVNFARHIKTPVYMTWGYNDDTCPPTTSYAVWNVMTCEKESLLTPINEHWTSDATDRGQMEWMKKALR
jgi:cephalosporin-C deacetylase-like acetyl esterase